MAVNWGLAASGQGFDYLESLRAIGQQNVQQEQLGQLQLRRRVGAQVQAGDTRGASATALQGGDFETAQKIASLQDADRKRLAGEARVYAGVATRLRSVPQDQREVTFAKLAPILSRAGFAHHELADLDLSDQGLDGYIQLGRDILDHSDAQDEPSVIRSLRAIGIDPQSEQGRDLVTRSIAAPRFIQKPDGSFMVVGGPGPGSGSASAEPPPNGRGPAPGAIEDGYRFRGGNPADPSAWEQVGGAPSQGGATFR